MKAYGEVEVLTKLYDNTLKAYNCLEILLVYYRHPPSNYVPSYIYLLCMGKTYSLPLISPS
jgi:hypothetical protein